MNKHLLIALLAGTFVLPHPAWAVSDSEFEQLKKQMSQMAARMETLESDQTKLKQENQDLKTRNARLEKKTAEVAEVAQAAQAAAPVKEEKPLPPGEVRIPGTDTTVKLGGFVKVDAIHDMNVTRTGNAEDFSNFATIPLKGSADAQKGGNTRIHARQTRINLTTKTPTDYGDLKVFFEGDFYRDPSSQTVVNSEDFGLRHAYGELGPVLFGQTWSNFMDMDAYPESLDFVGPAGITLLRQAQIRYTYKPDGSKHSYSIAVENPQTDFSNNPANPGADTNINQFPDLTTNLKFANDKGEVSVKGVLRDLGAYDATTTAKEKGVGYGLGLSGKINVFEKDDIRFQAAYGDGIGRYIFDVALGNQGAAFDANNDDLETITAYGGYVAYHRVWSDKWRSNLILGRTQIDNPDSLPAGTTNKSVSSAEFNTLWALTPKIDLGAGYIYGHRETKSGAEGNLHRFQLSGIYKF